MDTCKVCNEEIKDTSNLSYNDDLYEHYMQDQEHQIFIVQELHDVQGLDWKALVTLVANW